VSFGITQEFLTMLEPGLMMDRPLLLSGAIEHAPALARP